MQNTNTLACLICLLPVLCAPAVAGEVSSEAEKPTLLEQLIEKARAQVEAKREILQTYIFEQHEVTEVRKPKGKVTQKIDRVVLIVPVAWGTEEYLRKVDGEDATEKQQKPFEKRNRKRRERYEKKQQKATRSGEEESGAESSLVELIELLNRTNYRIVGRENHQGRELVCIEFDPSEGREAKGMERKIFRHMQGTACLDSESGEPVRFDVGNTGKFRLRGVVGVKEVSLSLRQERVNEEIWLPASVHFKGLASVLGVKRRVDSRMTFGNYRKATVEITESVGISPEELEQLLAEEAR